MKQKLNVGSVVDDGTGDYLRAGGLKLNNNFDELYYQLGDGMYPHAAGAWKTYSTSEGAILEADFGKSYTLNTEDGRITVNLPKGAVANYNYVIRLRDVFGTWQRNPVRIVPASGDTIKGSPNAVEINRNFADLELVYCAPGRWEYIQNKSIDRIDNNDIATVVTQEYIASQGQRDFMNVFETHDYNPVNLKVYHRGNLLFYGANNVFDPNNAEVGSPVAGDPEAIQEYDGKNIRLKNACNEGDTVIVVSYMDGLGQWRSSYNRRQVRVLDQKYTDKTTINGSIVVADLENKNMYSMLELGVTPDQPVNPNTVELSINSVLQYQAGTAGLPTFRCEGAEADNSNDCFNANGNWVESATDFLFELNDDDTRVEAVRFDKPLEHGDIITLIWYNNNIGTTLSLDDILLETDSRYISSTNYVNITGGVRITDYNEPFWPNVEATAPTEYQPNTIAAIFDLIHPVGTIYENTVNPNNPATYMGFGQWKRLESTVLVGWSSDPGSRFNLNNNHLDPTGQMQSTAGGTGGNANIILKAGQIPMLRTDDKVLVADDNGPIVIGGCQFDPDSQGPAYTKYREEQATINKENIIDAASVDIMNPYITVYRWMRVS
jgi:hypothetical protein